MILHPLRAWRFGERKIALNVSWYQRPCGRKLLHKPARQWLRGIGLGKLSPKGFSGFSRSRLDKFPEANKIGYDRFGVWGCRQINLIIAGIKPCRLDPPQIKTPDKTTFKV